jgi:hypothetical protein
LTQRPRRAWLADILTIAALLLLPLLFWWRLWAPDAADRATLPQGDLSDQYFPLQAFAAGQLAAGRLPGWDPYLNAGQPGLADVQTGFYYPPNLVANLALDLLGQPFTLEVLAAQVVLHFSLASLFTYLLVRQVARHAGARRGAARFAGAVAALSFAYAGYLTSFPVQQLTILETAVWLPLVLFFLDRAACSARPLPQLLLAGGALACALLAGHPQTAMYVVYVAVLYGALAWRLRGTEWEGRQPRRLAPRAAGLALFALLPLALGAALAAVQLVPALGFIGRSTRAGLGYRDVSWGFPLSEATHLLYPGYFGGSPQYVGILPPILALAACLVPRLRPRVIFWLVLAGLSFLLAFGGNTAVYRAAYLLLPGFGAVRNQERIIYLFGLAVGVLAGIGALTLVQPLPPAQRRGLRRLARGLAWAWVAMAGLTFLYYLGHLQAVGQGVEAVLDQREGVNLFEGVLRHHVLLLLILGGAALLFWLRSTGKARRAWLAALTLGLIWLNLFTVNGQYNQVEPEAGGPFPQTGLVSFLKAEPGTFRISSAGLLPGGASAGIVYEIEDITGNTPLRLAAFEEVEEGLGAWRRWQLLNVRYVLSERDLEGPGLEQVYEEDGVKVYRVGDPLPRAWVVHRVVPAADGEALAILDSEGFDPRHAAVVPAGGAELHLAGGERAGSEARVVEARPGYLLLEVAPGGEGLLVVSQPFYPGWQARVDGRPVPIVRADYLLQGVPVDAESRLVELTYRLPAWPALVSLAALLAAAVVGLALGRRGGHRGAPAVCHDGSLRL